jgi:hypothetical protein
MNPFVNDIESILGKMKVKMDKLDYQKMLELGDRLYQLRTKGLVKINHSVMELISAKHLIERGYEVELEHTMSNGLSCDIYAEKGYGSAIVEVETGFVPPEHAVDPLSYLKARIASKITRYSGYANKFVLATPPYYIMQIIPALTKPPRFRSDSEVEMIKNLCDRYYKNPPINNEEIRNARLHAIYSVDVDNLLIKDWDVNEYIGKSALWT